MYWTLVVLTVSGAPLPTNLVFDSLDACYQAEEWMAGEQSRQNNDRVSRNIGTSQPPERRRNGLQRGLCIPHSQTETTNNLSKKITSTDPERLHQFAAMENGSGPPVEAFISPVLDYDLPKVPLKFRMVINNPTARTVNIQNPRQNLNLIFYKPDVSRVELPDKVGVFRLATVNGRKVTAEQDSYSIDPKSSLEIVIECEALASERIMDAVNGSEDKHVDVSAFLLLIRAPAPGVTSYRLYDKIRLRIPKP